MQGFKHDSIEKLKLDVGSDEEVKKVIQTVIEKEGRIDIVLNNAGMSCVSEYRSSCQLNIGCPDFRSPTSIDPLIDVPGEDIHCSQKVLKEINEKNFVESMQL